MAKGHIYKKIEIVGTSSKSQDDAILNAITRAGKTVHNIRWYEVVESRGAVEGGNVVEFQVTLKVSFTLDD